MKSTDRKTLEEIIRVDHAGERGAIKIYEGQLLALSTFKKNEKLKKTIQDMKEHEIEHFNCVIKRTKELTIKGDGHPNEIMHSMFSDCIYKNLKNLINIS